MMRSQKKKIDALEVFYLASRWCWWWWWWWRDIEDHHSRKKTRVMQSMAILSFFLFIDVTGNDPGAAHFTHSGFKKRTPSYIHPSRFEIRTLIIKCLFQNEMRKEVKEGRRRMNKAAEQKYGWAGRKMRHKKYFSLFLPVFAFQPRAIIPSMLCLPNAHTYEHTVHTHTWICIHSNPVITNHLGETKNFVINKEEWFTLSGKD